MATTPDSGVTVSRPSSAPHAAPLSDDGSAPRRLALADVVGRAAAAASPRLLPLAVEDDKKGEVEVEGDKECTVEDDKECPATPVEDDKECTPASGGAPSLP